MLIHFTQQKQPIKYDICSPDMYILNIVKEYNEFVFDVWQSRIEIEYYSVAYFERITEFDAL